MRFPRLIRGLPLFIQAIASVSLSAGCHTPEAYYRNTGGVSGDGATGGRGGAGGGFGSGGDGTGGMALSTGGADAGGAPGTGGEGTGGEGTGGAATGGAAGATGGMAGDSGMAGAGGIIATGGNGGSAGSTGGAAGHGGAGSAATGGAGAGGNTGTDPCMGLCSGAISVAINANSGALGTKATCHQVVGTANGIVCGNFASSRTLKVNGTTVACTGSGVAIPAKRNGGYCMQATPGDYSYAYFATY